MGHWYTKEGEPMHWIIGANGKERDTTLRDARKLNLLPSVTEIIGILDKPGLNNWFQTKLLYACLTLPRPEDISDDEFLKIVRQDAKEEAEQAKLRGNLIHDALEVMVDSNNTRIIDLDVSDIAAHAIEIMEERFGVIVDNFTPEKTVAGDGYGGMIDLHNDDFLFDWKTKDITDKQWDDYQAGKDPRLAYDEQAMQLAAYDRALKPTQYLENRRCINVFIDRTEPGKVIIHEWKADEIEHAWKMFQSLLTTWQLKKRYYP